jgi:hypothetical protein
MELDLKHSILFITKRDCELCEKAFVEIISALEISPFYLKIIDVEDDPKLYEKYKHEVPVILLDDIEIARHRVNKSTILSALNANYNTQ